MRAGKEGTEERSESRCCGGGDAKAGFSNRPDGHVSSSVEEVGGVGEA